MRGRCGEDGEARAAEGGQPAGDGEGAIVLALQDDQVAAWIGESVEAAGEGTEGGSPGVGVQLFDHERGQFGASGDAGDAQVVGQAECACGAGGDRVWRVGEAECSGQGQQSGRGRGVGEEGVGVSGREHGAMVAPVGPVFTIGIMQRSSKVRWPAELRSGSRVALVCGSGPLRGAEDVERAERNCRSYGWEPVRGEAVLARAGYLAGDDAVRLRDVQWALDDPAIDGVWCVRGGYGLTRIVPQLSFARSVERPKAVIGFSDVTALHRAIATQGGVVTFHAHSARAEMPAMSTRSLLAAVRRDGQPCGEWHDAVPVRSGSVRGRLAGGNLALLASLCGTRDALCGAGAIVVLEDVNEPAYRVDRMLRQLEQSGAFDGCVGLAVGQFTDVPSDEQPDAMTVDDVIAELASRCRVPCLANLPIGHIADQWTVPLGAVAALDVDRHSLVVEVDDRAVT